MGAITVAQRTTRRCRPGMTANVDCESLLRPSSVDVPDWGVSDRRALLRDLRSLTMVADPEEGRWKENR